MRGRTLLHDEANYVETGIRLSLTTFFTSRLHLNTFSVAHSVIIMVGLLSTREEEMEAVRSFTHWNEPRFLLSFCLAAGMGSILNYSIFLCTLYNSALTTTVVGCLKVTKAPFSL